VSSDRDEAFLVRWSRRKHAARRGEALSEPAPAEAPPENAPPAPPAGAAAPAAEAAARELPPVDSLKGIESEYREFLRPDVDPATRSAALKKLFSDPHFNRMDGLDVYIDDYTKADPIPAAMLRALTHARNLGLFEEEEKTGAPGGAPGAAPAAVAEARPESERPREPADPARPDEAEKPTDA
jgi:hypothetical protein